MINMVRRISRKREVARRRGPRGTLRKILCKKDPKKLNAN